MTFFPLCRTLGAALLCLAVLTGCDRIKQRVLEIVEQTQPPPPPSPVPEAKPLTPEEEAMNKMLQDPKLFDATTAAAEEALAAPVVEINKSATVAVLGYHDFRERGGTPMIIAGSKFRQQMQAIKDAKLPVIPMSDLLAWKRGEKNVPEEAVVITMDDGWEGVYEIAFPILKEFGYPFTIYLYKKYVNIGGRSLTWAEIKEMMQHGCEVGSHTVSHEALTKKGSMNDEQYHAWLLSELKDSKEFLEQNLGVKMTSVAYPYGNHNPLIEDLSLQVGYEAGITVNGAKVSHDQPNGKIARYIIHGEEDSVFRMATSFRARGELTNAKSLALDTKDAAGTPLVQVKPEANSTIKERRPLIEANLIKLGSIVPESLKVRVSGFGVVPATFDPATFLLRYQVPFSLRREECNVTITFKRDLTAEEEMITWKFKIDLAAAYLPLPGAVPMVPAEVVPAATKL